MDLIWLGVSLLGLALIVVSINFWHLDQRLRVVETSLRWERDLRERQWDLVRAFIYRGETRTKNERIKKC